MRGTRKVGPAALAISLTVVATLIATPGTGTAASAGRTLAVQNLAPGLTLTRINDPAGPYQVYVLNMDPSQPSTLDVAVPGGEIGSYAKPSQIGAAHSALAAINGDFSVNPGRPLHALATDGTLTQSALQNGPSFALSKDETQSFMADHSLLAGGHRLAGGRTFSIADTNGHAPAGAQITAYTKYGGWWARPPANACSVRLRAPGRLHWGPNGMGVVRDWVVGTSVCSPGVLGVIPGTMVLSSHRTGAGSKTLIRMKRGDAVRLTWSLGWPDVMDSVGGMPMLVNQGKALTTPNCHDYFCSRNPRTGIGITADGHILMVVVDGRGNSVGMTLDGFAHYMISLGATQALNLDGGGGSAMWIAGQGVINHPSDYSGERPVTNAVLILPGADPGEGSPLPYSDAAAVGRSSSFGHGRIGARTSELLGRQAMAASSNDPGSTGGLLSAVAAGDL